MKRLEIGAFTLSILGGTVLALKFAIAAQSIWILSSFLWIIHFKRNNDVWGQRLFALYLIQHFLGVIIWS